ncbi:MAG TPA: aminotransferase class I/II-fold pyridoxal phosphate-dependent enzyme [Vicinamibacterales bacterium]|nr:aminotransferase class I/II-fold pyridoxal phosphate-dependent enzyme [Vicinamibacterales bacterium]
MDARHPFSRRRFVGGVAAAFGALGLNPSGLLAQGRTAQFLGGEAEYDAFAKLASNENNWGPPQNVMQAMNHAWKYANRYGYPDANVIQEIAAHHGVKPENVLLTPGSGEVLEIVGEAFLMGNTKKVVGADPTYASVFQHASQIKAEGVKVPLLKDYRQDIPTMINEANKNAASVGLFYLCNPNNPTGAVVTAAEVRQVVENIPKTMPILIDEAYHHFVDDPAYGTSVPYVLEGRPVIVARTFSKIAALAAMRVGYAISTPEIIKQLRVYSSNSVNVLAKHGAVASLKDTAGQAEVKAKITTLRNKTTRELEAHGYAVIPSQTNFFMVSLGDNTVQPTIAAFKEKGILVGRPFPPMLNHLRVSVGLPEEMDKFTAAFKEIFPKKAPATSVARG